MWYILGLGVTFKQSHMNENLRDDIWEERKMSQYSLDTFAYERGNIFDSPIDTLIEDLKAKFNHALKEYNKLEGLYNKDRSMYYELEEEANLRGESVQMQMLNYFEEARYLENELFSLFEMKIIYAFKHLEINIKQLLTSAYKYDSINRQYKWDSIVQFLNSQEINPKELNFYEEVNQLRYLNNSLKHSDRVIDQSLKNINEFKDKISFSYGELELFYNRIKQAPDKFLTSLTSQVFKDLYTFSEDRILGIAKSFALRMGKNEALQFAEELKKLYK